MQMTPGGTEEEKYGESFGEQFYDIKTDLQALAVTQGPVNVLYVPPRPGAVFASHVTRDRSLYRDILRYLSDGILHHEHVCHGPELTKILPESLLICLPAQAAHKQLPWGGV